MPVSPISLPEDTLARATLLVRGRYSFAVDGGAQATIPITSGTPIPSGSTVVWGYVDVTTQATGAGASIACQVEAANDILTAVAIASWTTGRKNILPAGTTGALTASTAVKTTADRNISIVVTGGNLTAGIFDVILLIVPPLA